MDECLAPHLYPHVRIPDLSLARTWCLLPGAVRVSSQAACDRCMCQGEEGNRCFLNSKSIDTGVGRGEGGPRGFAFWISRGRIERRVLRGWVKGACGKQPWARVQSCTPCPGLQAWRRGGRRQTFCLTPSAPHGDCGQSAPLRRPSHES